MNDDFKDMVGDESSNEENAFIMTSGSEKEEELDSDDTKSGHMSSRTAAADHTAPSEKQQRKTSEVSDKTDDEGGQDGKMKKMTAKISTISVTDLEKNKSYLYEDDSKILLIQEHKVKKGAMKKMMGKFRKNGWKLRCDPCDESTKKPSAGVGAAVKEDISIMKTKTITKEFAKAQALGRVGKYIIDLGWKQHIQIYVIYGATGGTRKAENLTNAIIDAIKMEIEKEQYMPTIIAGDFNNTLCKLQSAKELIEDQGWIGVGQKAHWWGGIPNEHTCWARANAKASRIDGFSISPEVIPFGAWYLNH